MVTQRAMTAEDLFQLKFISDPNISPAGNEVAFVVTTVNEEKEYQGQIWIAGDSCQPIPFTQGKKVDSSPKWSPRGDQLAFLSSRNGDKQIWVMSRFGGEAHQITQMYYGVGAFSWSPDGRQMAFTSPVGVSDNEAELVREKTDKEREAEKKDRARRARVVTDIAYKSDDLGFLDDRKNMIWAMDLQSGKPRRITQGERNYSKPLWSPDGTQILAVAEPEDAAYQRGITELHLIDPASGEVRNILPEKMLAANPAWSPDGTKIAFFGHQHELKNATLFRIWILDLQEGTLWQIKEENDFGPTDFGISDMRAGSFDPGPVWSLDGQSLYTMVSEWGSTGIYRYSLEGQVEKVLTGEREIYGFTMDDDRQRIAFTYTTVLQPGELAVYDLPEAKETRLTEFNAGFLAGLTLSVPEEVRFTGADGWTIQGWVMKPIGFTEGQRYPLVLEIHGGPHGMYAHSFFHEFQLLAAHGFGVIYCNPRGSAGYGQRFVDAVRGDYGGKDYEDLMAFVDLAAEWDWVDTGRLGVTGGSYGGFMTNWIVGHTGRFKAAVTARCISNWTSFSGVSDVGAIFADWQHKADFIQDEEELRRISPLTYVQSITTPLLILHGENDYRCPLEQAEQLYTYLKYLRRETQLVIFPGSNHNLSRSGKPELRVERLNQIIGWFRRYLGCVE